MIDIETLGTQPDSTILSIGAHPFWFYAPMEYSEYWDGDRMTRRKKKLPAVGPIEDGFYRRIDIYLSEPLRVSPGTLLFWARQPPESFRDLLDPEGAVHLGTALIDLATWIGHKGFRGTAPRIWANDPSFDLVMLTRAYHSQSLKLPWEFRQERSYRTIKNHVDLNDIGRNLPHHHAHFDAMHQARELAGIGDLIEGKE